MANFKETTDENGFKSVVAFIDGNILASHALDHLHGRLAGSTLQYPQLRIATGEADGAKKIGDTVTRTIAGEDVDVVLGRIADVTWRVTHEDLALDADEFAASIATPAFEALVEKFQREASEVESPVLVTAPLSDDPRLAGGHVTGASRDGLSVRVAFHSDESERDLVSIDVLYGFASAAGQRAQQPGDNMTFQPYPVETIDDDVDDGTIVENVQELSDAVVGHRIVAAERRDVKTGYGGWRSASGLVLTLDNGTRVELADTDDCCAYTELESFLLHPDKVDHIITGVGTTDEYQTWHIYADMGDVLELSVGWSCGNPFFYGYGFEIRVVPVEDAA